jgi:hypothetical protein
MDLIDVANGIGSVKDKFRKVCAGKFVNPKLVIPEPI